MNSRRKFLKASGFTAAAAFTASSARSMGVDVPSFWQTSRILVIHHEADAADSAAVGKKFPGAIIVDAAAGHFADNDVSTSIQRRGDLKIGLITLKRGSTHSINEINSAAASLKKSGCDITVCSSSLGFRGQTISDEELARTSKNIHLIVSSNNDEPVLPRVLHNADDHEVLIDNAGGTSGKLAGLEIKFNSAREKIGIAFLS